MEAFLFLSAILGGILSIIWFFSTLGIKGAVEKNASLLDAQTKLLKTQTELLEQIALNTTKDQ